MYHRHFIVRQPNGNQRIGGAFNTLPEAIDHATRQINSNGQHNEAIIYEAVYGVERQPQPAITYEMREAPPELLEPPADPF